MKTLIEMLKIDLVLQFCEHVDLLLWRVSVVM